MIYEQGRFDTPVREVSVSLADAKVIGVAPSGMPVTARSTVVPFSAVSRWNSVQVPSVLVPPLVTTVVPIVLLYCWPQAR